MRVLGLVFSSRQTSLEGEVLVVPELSQGLDIQNRLSFVCAVEEA